MLPTLFAILCQTLKMLMPTGMEMPETPPIKPRREDDVRAAKPSQIQHFVFPLISS